MQPGHGRAVEVLAVIVDVDHAVVHQQRIPLTGFPFSQVAAHRQDQLYPVVRQGLAGRGVPRTAEHTACVRVVGVDGRFAARSGDDVSPGQFGEACDQGASADGVVADQQRYPAAVPQARANFSDQPFQRAVVHNRFFSCQKCVKPGMASGTRSCCSEYVDGNTQVRGALRVAQGNGQGGGQFSFQLVWVCHHGVVAGTTGKHGHDIHSITRGILETTKAEIRNPGLGGDDQHGCLLGMGARHAGNQVGGAGAGGGATDADSAAFAGVSIRHECRARFMAGKDQAGTTTFFTAHQGIEQRAERAAGHAEYIFHAKLFQVFHNQITICHN